MIQVDFFLSYALGGSMSLTSVPAGASPTGDASARAALVRAAWVLGLVWAPSGLLLLWTHPAWETMQVAQHLDDVPVWLVVVFGLTNFTQGVLGYVVTQRLLIRGKRNQAVAHTRAGFFVTFFLLTFGWDGHGYDRLLYAPAAGEALKAWTPAAGASLSVLPAALWGFLGSPVALLLMASGGVLVGAMGWHMASGLLQQWAGDARRPAAGLGVFVRVAEGLASYLAGILGVSFVAALVCALLSGAALGLIAPVGAGAGSLQALLACAVGVPAGLLVSWPVLLQQRALSGWLLKPLFAARVQAVKPA